MSTKANNTIAVSAAAAELLKKLAETSLNTAEGKADFALSEPLSAKENGLLTGLKKKPARRGALTEAGKASIRAAVMARFTALPESGTKLQKLYKGKMYTAFVNADGSVDMDCDIEGTEQTHFNSLTHAARTITGAKNISGRKFFGCAGKRLDATPAEETPAPVVEETPAAEEAAEVENA